MVYTVLFLIGLIGTLSMALVGGGHHAGGAGGAHGGHAGGAHPGHHASHGHHIDHAGRGGRFERLQDRGLAIFWSLLSPLALFGLCLGAGATGLLLGRMHLAVATLGICAVAGALLVQFGLIRPALGFVMRFASKPSEALAGAMATTAEAEARFDASGRGVVKLLVDGQVVRVLATLDPEDSRAGSVVEPGDQLLVTYVDGRRNRCRVSRI